MGKRTTTARPVPTAPNLRGLIRAAGMKPVDLASRARISVATVYKAMKGSPVSRLQSWAMSAALGVTEAELHASIEAGARAAS